jgi:RNA polymerase sigma factor for flagellar operon FliA
MTEGARRQGARDEEEVSLVWTEFKRSGDGTLRNQLIERYLYLVKVIANRIAARLPRSIDVQDLRSAGVFGLIRAIENFDTSRGTRFESYCATRVHGAILDELRAQDWVPRLVRNRADVYRKAFFALRSSLDRDPSTRELAVHLGLPDEEVEVLRRESNLTTVYTLCREDESNDETGQVRKLDVLVDHDSEVPFDELVTRDLAASLSKQLTQAERTVVALYYNDALTMKEIGRVMRISESRVCQIHTKLLKKLKEHLDGIANGTPSPAARRAAAAGAAGERAPEAAPRAPLPAPVETLPVAAKDAGAASAQGPTA